MTRLLLRGEDKTKANRLFCIESVRVRMREYVYLEWDHSHVGPMRWNEFQLITRNDARRIAWIAN